MHAIFNVNQHVFIKNRFVINDGYEDEYGWLQGVPDLSHEKLLAVDKRVGVRRTGPGKKDMNTHTYAKVVTASYTSTTTVPL